MSYINFSDPKECTGIRLLIKGELRDAMKNIELFDITGSFVIKVTDKGIHVCIDDTVHNIKKLSRWFALDEEDRIREGKFLPGALLYYK